MEVKNMIDIGRIVIKTSGREALRKAVVVDIIDKNYALVTGPPQLSGVKRRRVNINHIEPTNKKLEITRKATDADVLAAAKAAKLDAFINERLQIST
jgi:large subunit ribosomal protein L14e